MTVENCIKRLAAYKERMENPQGTNGDQKAYVKKQATLAYEDMKKHILTAEKFAGHEILAELGTKPKAVKGKK